MLSLPSGKRLRIVSVCSNLFLKSKSDTGLIDSIEYIKTKNIEKPIFIFTKEVLFNTKDIKFYKYFEVKNNEFQNGVIIVE